MQITLTEIVFAAVATGIVFMIVVVIRSGLDRQRKAEDARVYGDDPDASHSSILVRGGEPVTLEKAPEPTDPFARLDRWFTAAVQRSGLDATPSGVVALMALTGLVLAGFVFIHMLGNLQMFCMPEKINAYALFLHHGLSPSVIWLGT